MKGWWMVKSKTCQDAEILVRNPSLRPFQKSKKQTMKKRDFETYQKRFRDFEILPKFSETHVFQGTIRHPFMIIKTISKFLGQLRETTHWK